PFFDERRGKRRQFARILIDEDDVVPCPRLSEPRPLNLGHGITLSSGVWMRLQPLLGIHTCSTGNFVETTPPQQRCSRVLFPPLSTRRPHARWIPGPAPGGRRIALAQRP